MSKEQTSEEELDNDSSEKIIENEKIDEEDKIPLSEHEKIKDEYLRLAADFENYKKRSEKEKESIGTASMAYFVESLFPLVDNFEMALSQDEVSKEIETFSGLLTSVLESLQVQEVGSVGDDFDPKIHEAVEHAGEGDTQKVQAVLRKGYLFQGNLIRPAMVKVISE
ncbi:MAG: nucleotide exchange factor GrpE [Candidatus Actinomarina sp.]|jgi:molecular chaperone GrpE|tara:strand:- start:234 stop:734 length:501 start_codon:yes stop_codon:yes gene_type:complete